MDEFGTVPYTSSAYMESVPKNIDVLQNLEFVVNRIWRQHREMSDYVAGRAYEAVFEHFRAEMRGHQSGPCTLTGLDREVFDDVKSMCEWRLGRATAKESPAEAPTPVSLSELVDCLRELRKSVERHTKIGGRQGYLTFIEKFM